jgi:hypothetical protein
MPGQYAITVAPIVTPSNRFAKTRLRKFLAVSEICQAFALSCKFSNELQVKSRGLTFEIFVGVFDVAVVSMVGLQFDP